MKPEISYKMNKNLLLSIFLQKVDFFVLFYLYDNCKSSERSWQKIFCQLSKRNVSKKDQKNWPVWRKKIQECLYLDRQKVGYSVIISERKLKRLIFSNVGWMDGWLWPLSCFFRLKTFLPHVTVQNWRSSKFSSTLKIDF